MVYLNYYDAWIIDESSLNSFHVWVSTDGKLSIAASIEEGFNYYELSFPKDCSYLELMYWENSSVIYYKKF